MCIYKRVNATKYSADLRAAAESMDVASVWERLLTGNVSSSELIGIAVGLGLGLLVWAVVLVRVFFCSGNPK